MASASTGSFYLPALDDLLQRRQAIVSWRTLFIALAEPLATAQTSSIDRVLQDQKVRQILIDPFSAHQKPTQESRTQFDNLTSAINAPASKDGQYDVKELKDDALWLSKEVGADEVTSLRTVLLEWQDRPRRKLLSRWSEDEIVGLRTTTAASSSAAFSSLLNHCEILPPGDEALEVKHVARDQLLALFWSEQEYLWKSAEAVFGLAQQSDMQLSTRATPKAALSPELRLTTTSLWDAHGDAYGSQGKKDAIAIIAESLQGLFEMVTQPQRWPASMHGNAAASTGYLRSTLETMITQLRLLQIHLRKDSQSPTTTSEITAWFGMLQDCFFFSPLEEIDREQCSIIASLVVFNSVDLLRIGPAMEYLYNKIESSESTFYPKLSRKSYIEDAACLRSLTECFLSVLDDSKVWMGPVCLVWAVLAQHIRILSDDLEGETNLFLADGQEDNSDRSSRRSSLKGSTPRPTSKLDILLKAIVEACPKTEEGADAIEVLGRFALGAAGAPQTSDQMVHNLSQAFRLPSDIHTTSLSKMTAMDILRHAIPMVASAPALADSLVEVLSYDFVSTPDPSTKDLSLWPSQPAKSLDDDKEGLGSLMAQVVARYPYEMGPFAVCLQSAAYSEAYVDEDGSKIALLLEGLDSFTCEIPLDWPCTPSNEPDRIILQQDLPIFELQRGVPSTITRKLFTIPAGTEGLTLAEKGRCAVIRWYHRHSALEYIGALLASRSKQARTVAAFGPSDLDVRVEADLVALLTTMLRGALTSSDVDAPKLLLGRISDGMDRNNDIISVVFSTFEYHLQRHAVSVGDDSLIALLVQCIEFMKITMHVFPDRVWNQLGRSSLLPINDISGALVSVVGSTEIPMARFKFLAACTTLYESLISDCTRRAALQESSATTKAVARFGDANLHIPQTPYKTMSTLLFNFSRVLLDVLQSQTNWRFDEPVDRSNIVSTILRSSNTILQLAFATGTGTKGLCSTVEPAASGLATVYLTNSEKDLPMLPIIDTLVTALAELGPRFEPRHSHELLSAAVESLRFCTSLLRVGMAKEKSGAALRNQLFRALPILARLLAVHEVFRPLVSDLLTVLVQYASMSSQDPPSLLGHLSAEATRSFLAVVTDTNAALQNLDTEVAVWDMLSAIVSNKQQWLAISLLTGSTPRERLKSGNNSTSTKKSLITTALDSLVKLETMPPRRALAMLAFVSHSQNHWEWISSTISQHSEFVSSASEWLSKLTSNTRQSDTEACIRNANENQMAAFVCDILARYTHNIRDGTQPDKAKRLSTSLAYLRDYATQVDGYNHSLHKNLIKNFDQKFGGISLDSFKRATLTPADLGPKYYYDLDLADKVLGHDPSWRRAKGQGFVDEVARANVNFSLVDSQIALLKSWKSLAMELLSVAGSDPQIQKDMVKVVTGCLRANIDSTIPTQIFENVSETRVDFAFAILQHLHRAGCKEPEVKNLFVLTLEAIRATGLDFEVITEARLASYYRTLLQILFLALQPHVQDTKQDGQKLGKQSLSKSASTLAVPLSPLTGSFLEVLNKVIAVNFRALCTLVHSSTPETPTLAQPSDFVLLTALLQSLFRIPSTLTVHRQIASTVADASLIRYAISLYSWSDSLTPGDPGIYGEIAILFLLSLSTNPQVAEVIATESVLDSVSSANVTAYLRAPTSGSKSSGGCGPFDQPSRVHSIWSRGVLPLLLNIISAVGPGIAPEIAGFLNSFPLQLKRCATELLSPLQPSARDPYRGCITLGLAAEAQSLALLGSIIEGLRRQGAAIGVDAGEIEEVAFDRKAVGEAAEGLLRNRRGLGERIVSMGERDESLRKKKVGEGDALEDLVVKELQGVVDAASAI
ncbi:hypothetical protein KVT40_004229 [Elsinoe batatas]|uniref:Nucleoporin NUP188 n=1 Tax=Elsinoe batatas TaxID=2601811 RepID=A0A8K0L618_9PEZI|nr:hypothetical protein KVT40_004229 [Elsinoe batatas]